MRREYYSASIGDFCGTRKEEIIGTLTANSEFPVEQTQAQAWIEQIVILQETLRDRHGKFILEVKGAPFGSPKMRIYPDTTVSGWHTRI